MFITHIGEVFESVLASDIIGDNARTVKMDRQMGSEYAKFRVATGLATAIFFYSFTGGERKGVTAQRLRVAFLREGIPPSIVGDALKRLEDLDGPLYLHFEGGLYYFSSQVGLNRIIIEKEEAVREREEEILAEIKSRLEKVAGGDFEVFIWPKSNNDVPDNRRLKLIILPLELSNDNPSTEEFVKDMLTNYSTGYRTFKNTLIFLVPDKNECYGFRESVCLFLALKAIVSDKDLWKTLSEADKERASQKFKDMDSSVLFKTVSVYRYLLKGSKDGLRTFDLGIPSVGEKNLSSRVRYYLKEQEILLDKLSPKLLASWFLSKNGDRKNVAEIWEAFLKYLELPLLESEDVLKNTIRQGVQNGVFGVLMNDRVWYQEEVSLTQLTEDIIILKAETALEMKRGGGEEVSISSITAPPVIEGVQTTEVKIKEKVVNKIMIKAQVPWDKLSDLVRGVFIPLSHEGANIVLQVNIDAYSEHGIKRETLDLKIRETLNQIGAKILEEKEE
jgi:hypothetical protein